MEENILEKAARLLEFYFNVTKGDIGQAIDDSNLRNGEVSAEINYKKLKIESKNEYMKLLNFLADGGYISPQALAVKLKSKGVEEVIRGFPNLKPSLDVLISSVNDLFLKIDENTEDVLEKINQIKSMERYLEDIMQDIKLIQLKLEKILPDIEDEDLHDIVKKIINSPNIASALIEIFRLMTNPKITTEIKQIVTSEDTILSLPPRSQI